MIETRVAVKNSFVMPRWVARDLCQGRPAHVRRTAGLLHFDAGGRRGRAIKVALSADDLGEFIRIGTARFDPELEQTIGNPNVLRCIAERRMTSAQIGKRQRSLATASCDHRPVVAPGSATQN